ncbi:MAG: hypothetical protein CMK71_05325 [Pseudomonadaceae bacterium]|nr:hypothetical protein [Pseudomonadaceae bacterium]
MIKFKRIFSNVFGGWFQLKRCFPKPLLTEIGDAIGAGEAKHIGEVRFAIESRLSFAEVLAGVNSRGRAEQIFAQQGVWDTEHNSGILFYLLLSEHRIEIVADRGVSRYVEQARWDAICQRMCSQFALGNWREGSLAGIAEAHKILGEYLSDPNVPNPNELPNKPIIL